MQNGRLKFNNAANSMQHERVHLPHVADAMQNERFSSISTMKVDIADCWTYCKYQAKVCCVFLRFFGLGCLGFQKGALKIFNFMALFVHLFTAITATSIRKSQHQQLLVCSSSTTTNKNNNSKKKKLRTITTTATTCYNYIYIYIYIYRQKLQQLNSHNCNKKEPTTNRQQTTTNKPTTTRK